MNQQPVLIAAGGTGGHVFPALAVAQQLQAAQVPVVWLGTHRGLEAQLVPAAGLEIEWIEIGGLRGKGFVALLFAPWLLLRAAAACWRVLRQRQPRAVLGMGGFVAGPVGLVAWLLRIPLVIHEQNAIAGITNKLLARLATRVLEAMPGTFKQAECVGNPLREVIAKVPNVATRFAARSGAPKLLVVGGSQGARRLNAVVPQALHRMRLAKIEVWHITGKAHLLTTRDHYHRHGMSARFDAFLDTMDEAYGWADLVLCRSGAMTVAELAAVGLASILVPFPYAVDDHQTANAQFLLAAGAARLVAEQDLDAVALATLLDELLGDRARLREMAEAARSCARREAAQRVAQICLQVAR